MKLIIFTPYEQPFGQTSRNYDYAKLLVLNSHDVVVITNNFDHRKKKRIVVATNKHYEITTFEGVKIIWLNTREYYDNGVGRVINSISYFFAALGLKLERPDYVLADSVPPTAGIVGYITSLKFKAKFIYQIRDVWPIALVYDGAITKINPLYWILRIIEIFLYRSSYKICSTVPLVADHVKGSFANPSKVVWVPNGLDLTRFPNPVYINNNDVVNIVYTGGYGNAHDVITIIKAVEILNKKKIPAVLNLYGDGIKRDECEKYVLDNRLENVFIHNTIPRSEIPKALDSADILVVAVTDSDAYKFGVNLNKLYDYMAAGRCIVFSCRTKHDPVSEADCGITIFPGKPNLMSEAFESLIKIGAEKRNEVGARGRNYALKYYDVNKIAAEFESMFN